MKSFMVVSALLLIGCKPAIPEPHTFTPMSCVLSAGLAIDSNTPTPDADPDNIPSFKDCEECGGKGWKGDGQPRSDCLACTHPKWDIYFDEEFNSLNQRRKE